MVGIPLIFRVGVVRVLTQGSSSWPFTLATWKYQTPVRLRERLCLVAGRTWARRFLVLAECKSPVDKIPDRRVSSKQAITHNGGAWGKKDNNGVQSVRGIALG